MKEKVRELRELPQEIKHNYFNVLFTMANIDEKINPLELAELYRFMAKMQLEKEERKVLLKQLYKSENNLENLCKNLYRGLNEQEKNIVRFSLIRDLMLLMKSDYYEAQEETDLFNQIKVLLNITEEHMVWFNEEKALYQDTSNKPLSYEGIEETVLMATAIGVPLTTFLFSDSFKKNPFLLKKSSHKRRLRTDLLRSIAIGGVSYHSLKWWLRRRKKKSMSLQQCMIEEVEKLQERAKRYMALDLQHLQQSLQWAEENFIDMELQRETIILLKKSLAVLHNTKPQEL
ncbi:tellurite resistance protein TerB [Clostridium aceticum]|uniref:Tellurite resistance protein TerB n=1 Tax=Clostridium aceticum TaxID=84022 RepID=A0A0D8I7Q7_9CLOT|nr:hypothetical protein [Clostridium aceticum]AKL94244.1 tellurite resistance protein TerB [Clostridium aceticum]KJF26094.1 hypothetical protein TZ02_14680 [Clostridium aceticum]